MSDWKKEIYIVSKIETSADHRRSNHYIKTIATTLDPFTAYAYAIECWLEEYLDYIEDFYEEGRDGIILEQIRSSVTSSDLSELEALLETFWAYADKYWRNEYGGDVSFSVSIEIKILSASKTAVVLPDKYNDFTPKESENPFFSELEALEICAEYDEDKQSLYIESIEVIPESIETLVELRALELGYLSSLKNFPASIQNLKNLTRLYIQSDVITQLPESIDYLRSLQELNLYDCSSLESLPQSIGKLVNLTKLSLPPSLESLPDSIGKLINLKALDLSECELLHKIPETIGKLVTLTKLYLPPSLESLPDSIENLKNLENLGLPASLSSVPNWIGNLPDSVLFHLEQGDSLKEYIQKRPQLKKLCFWSASEQLPDSIRVLTNLEELWLCGNLKELPEWITELHSLKKLDLSSYESADDGLIGLNLVRNLNNLTAFHLPSFLEEIPDWLSDLKNLEKLVITGYVPPKILPDSIESLRKVKELELKDIEDLEMLPDWIGKLKNLRKLVFSGYIYLEENALNPIEDFINVKEVYFTGCESLESLPESLKELPNVKIIR